MDSRFRENDKLLAQFKSFNYTYLIEGILRASGHIHPLDNRIVNLAITRLWDIHPLLYVSQATSRVIFSDINSTVGTDQRKRNGQMD
jgi:hypothetical protein